MQNVKAGDGHKAEVIQAIKAFLIPICMFVATIVSSAGVFLIYSGYAVGWCLVLTAALMITLSFVAFFTFQNKLRADGKYIEPPDNGPAEY